MPKYTTTHYTTSNNAIPSWIMVADEQGHPVGYVSVVPADSKETLRRFDVLAVALADLQRLEAGQQAKERLGEEDEKDGMIAMRKQSEANAAYQSAVTKAMTIAESLSGLLTDNWPAPDDDIDATWEQVGSMMHILEKLEEAKQTIVTGEE